MTNPAALSPITPPPAALTPLLAKLPLIPLEIAIGERTWHVTVVPDQTTFFEVYDQLEDPPYGFLLWESAVGLARRLAEQPQWVRNKRVLELGAGVGLPGLVAASLGADVAQTDHQSDILALTALNAGQNNITVTERFLADWRRWTHTKRYQLILGADILYDRALHFYLEEIFHRNLAPGGRLLLADPGRTQALEFMVKLEEHGWQVDLQTLSVKAVGEAQNRMVEVVIYQCTRVQRSAPNRSS